MRHPWRAAVLLGVGVLLGWAAVGCGKSGGTQGNAASQPAARKPAPGFNVKTLDGGMLSLSSLKGKVVILDFWATWCPPCRAEIPHFKELYGQYQGQGLAVVGLALDEQGETAVAPFAKENGINYPLALGTQELTQAYVGILGIPTTFLIDKQGRIVKKYVGYQDKEVFESEIKALLAE